MTARQLLGAICALTLIGIGACDKEHAPTELTTPADATPLFDEVLPADFADNPTDPDVPAATVAIEEFATTVRHYGNTHEFGAGGIDLSHDPYGRVAGR